METILYQGQQVQALLITEINVRRGEGMEAILRDGQGRYYFRRETYDEMGYHWARRNPEASNYRCRVHRMSLRAAILFQVAFAADRLLRHDAARLLTGKEAVTA